VIAILLGVLVRTFWAPGPVWRSGINFSAKTLLEIAIVLLGASLSAGTVWALGPILLFGIVTIVVSRSRAATRSAVRSGFRRACAS
jgi:uncharacterized membrane protein YadS